MQTNFAQLDKSDFKCLKTADGSIYYGQVVQILPPSVDTDKLAGFRPRDEARKPDGSRGSDSSAQPNAAAAAAMNATGSSGGFRLGTSDSKRTSAVPDPLQSLYQEGVEPLVVDDITQVDEELLPKLLTVRHGNGIQI